MENKIRACCFDLVNTLNNDTLLTQESVKLMAHRLADQGAISSPELFISTYNTINQNTQQPFYSHTFGEEEFFRLTFKELGISRLSPQQALEEYRKIVNDQSSLEPQVLRTMEYLSSQGVRRVLLSNERAARVDAYLSTTGLGLCLDEVIVSETVGVEKPNPTIFRETLKRLKITSSEAGSVLMFGDNSIADGACKREGLRFVLVTGYRSRSWYFERGDEFTPDYEIEFVTPKTVAALIGRPLKDELN